MFKRMILTMLVLCMMLTPFYGQAESDRPYEGVKLTILERDCAGLPFDVNSDSNRAISEATGIEIEFMLVADTDWVNKANTLLAANNMPDIARLEFSQVNQYAREGMFVNLSERQEQGQLPSLSAVLDKVGDVMNYYKVDGELYSFPLIWEIGLPNGAVPYIRGDVLKKLGLEAPKSFDELYTVLKAIKEHDPENYPWVTRWSDLQIEYAYGVGGLCYYDHDKGEYVSGYLDTGRYTDYLEYCNKLYSEGLIDPDFLTTSPTDWQEACKNGSCYFTYNNCVFVNQFNMALQADQPDAYWEPLHTLENPWGEKRGKWSVGVGEWQPMSTCWAVSADSENIDAALYLMDFMYSDKGFEITNWGVEGETFGKDEKGDYYMLPEFVDAVQGGEVTMQSKLSGADLGFCCLIDDWANRATALNEAGVELYEFWMNEKDMVTDLPSPVFTEDETERLADLRSRFDVVVADRNAFIIGTRPISEWEQVVSALEEAGIQEYLDIYNTALARIQGA